MVLADCLDPVLVRRFADCEAAKHVDVTFGIKDPRVTCSSLLIMANRMVHREREQEGVLVPYFEDGICSTLGLQGRLIAGTSSPDEFVESGCHAKILEVMPPFVGSCSLFSYPKVLKELLRGGLNGPCRDLDLKAAFPRAVHERHPDLRFVAAWVNANEDFVTQCRLTRAALKELVSAAAGIGDRGIRDWCQKHYLDCPPPTMQGFIDDLRLVVFVLLFYLF